MDARTNTETWLVFTESPSWWAKRTEYGHGYVVGTRYLDLDLDLEGDLIVSWNRNQTLKKRLASWGGGGNNGGEWYGFPGMSSGLGQAR